MVELFKELTAQLVAFHGHQLPSKFYGHDFVSGKFLHTRSQLDTSTYRRHQPFTGSLIGGDLKARFEGTAFPYEVLRYWDNLPSWQKDSFAELDDHFIAYPACEWPKFYSGLILISLVFEYLEAMHRFDAVHLVRSPTSYEERHTNGPPRADSRTPTNETIHQRIRRPEIASKSGKKRSSLPSSSSSLSSHSSFGSHDSTPYEQYSEKHNAQLHKALIQAKTKHPQKFESRQEDAHDSLIQRLDALEAANKDMRVERRKFEDKLNAQLASQKAKSETQHANMVQFVKKLIWIPDDQARVERLYGVSGRGKDALERRKREWLPADFFGDDGSCLVNQKDIAGQLQIYRQTKAETSVHVHAPDPAADFLFFQEFKAHRYVSRRLYGIRDWKGVAYLSLDIPDMANQSEVNPVQLRGTYLLDRTFIIY